MDEFLSIDDNDDDDVVVIGDAPAVPAQRDVPAQADIPV